MKGLIYLEDGTVFRGYGFGYPCTNVGELVFNTSMTGYQEILTDPSYKGQIINMTYPLIGNYGINSLDNESDKIHASGFIVKDISLNPSNAASEKNIDEWLREMKVPGVYGVDTRRIAKKIRNGGDKMSYTNTYYPDYEKMYPGVKITPEVLAVLRASDRQMRRFENELKTERFEADNEKQVARFIPSREDSYERLVEEDRLQFADEEMSVEDAVEYREMIRYLYQALAQLEVAEQALIRADFFLMKTEAECAKAAGISQPGYRKRRDRILRKLRKSLKECAPKDFQEILEKWL